MPNIPIKTGCKNVILIDDAIRDAYIFTTYANADTFPISYNNINTGRRNDKARILEILRQLGGGIERFGFVFELPAPKLDSTPFFTIADISESSTSATYSENLAFLLGAIREFSIKRIDFLACDTLKAREWTKFYDILTRETGIIVGASNDATGNIKSGGDWVMETVNQDIESVYFTESINYYEYVLGGSNTGSIIAITDTGDMLVSGSNDFYGQFGLGSPNFLSLTDRSSFLSVTEYRVFARGNNTFALTPDGIVYACGQNTYGELGTGDTNNRTVPTLITNPLGKTVKDIACGDNHTIMLMTDGTVYATGYNAYGQLCLGNTNTTNCNTLTQITALDGKTPKLVACGGDYTIMIMTDGTLYSAGRNNYGQLGLGDNDDRGELVNIQWLYNYTPATIACGKAHTVVCTYTPTQGGYIFVTGWNASGQLGTGNTTDSNTFAPIFLDDQMMQISCGDTHTILISTSKSTYATGSNVNGELGFGDNANRSTFTQITLPDYNTAKYISCGSAFTFIAMIDGSVYATGANTYGVLGLGHENNRNTLARVTVPGDVSPQIIACGGSHAVALTTLGSFYASGWNAYGQLGTGSTTDQNILTAILTLPPASSGSVTTSAKYFRNTFAQAGGYTGLFLIQNEKLYAIGNNASGMFGLGSAASGEKYEQFVQVPIPDGKIPDKVMSGGLTTIVVMTDGSIYGAGYNNVGGLGLGDTDGRQELTHITIPDNKTIQDIATGWSSIWIVTTDGLIYRCGYNGGNYLGTGDTNNLLTLTPIISPDGKLARNVYCVDYSTVIVMTDNTSYGIGGVHFGTSSFVQISVPAGKIPQNITFSASSSLWLMTDGTVYILTYMFTEVSLQLDGKVAQSTASGGYGAYSILTTDGSIYVSGLNNRGQLGLGDTSYRDTYTELTIPTGKMPYSIHRGYSDFVVVMTDGSVYACGYNMYGFLGYMFANVNTNIITVKVPRALLYNKTPMKISSGKYHNAVTMTDGTVYTAGSNSSGQLGIFGIGDNINYDNVPSFTPISVPDGKTVQKIVCGEQHTCIIMTDGSLYGAGSNYNGELGLGLGGPNQSAIFVQIPIPDGKTVKDVNCGALHTVIITTDGYLYGAGLNYSGQLGLGNYTESITTFTRINVYDEKVPNIVGCGSNSTIVQMTDGSVYGTGGNGYGQLGQGDLANRNRLTLIPLPSGKRAKGVVSGEGHTVIPMTDGTIYGCGQNGYYQLTSNYNSNNVLIQMPTPSGKTIKSIIGNDQRTTILMTDGTIYFTGNKYNQYRLQFTQINQFSNIQYLSESFQLIWASGINQPYALVAYGSYMYVGRRGAGSGIDRYELSDGSLDTENWVNGGASNMFNIASMAVDGSYLYAVASATPENPPEDPTNIFKISLTDASIVSNNWAPGVNLVGTIAIYGAFMYAVHYSDGAIHKLSLVDGSVVSENFATIDLVGDTNNTIMNIDDAGTYLYVQRGLGRISKISLLDGMVVNTNWINIPPQAPLNYQLDVFGLHGPSTYAINNDNGKIVQINVLSRRITNASYAASTVWTNETSVISAITVFGSSLYAARADTGTIDKFALPAISNICFPASAPVQTDQGIVTIARLDPMLHTIEGMRIVDVTKTVTNDSFLVRIGRDALGKDYPVQDTVISRLHKIEYGGRMVAAEWFVGQIAGVEEIPYSGEPLYNVILAEPRTMRVNNLVCETLLPNNPIAKLYARSSRYTEYTRDIILSLLKTHTASNNHEAYRRVLSSL